MAIPTVQVLATLVNEAGIGLAGASIAATPSDSTVYQGVAVPMKYVRSTDEAGRCVLYLYASDLGPRHVTYTIEMWAAYACEPVVVTGVVVPMVDSITLEELLGWVPVLVSIYWNDDAFWDDSAFWTES